MALFFVQTNALCVVSSIDLLEMRWCDTINWSCVWTMSLLHH